MAEPLVWLVLIVVGARALLKRFGIIVDDGAPI